MALTKINNNTLSAITGLPAGVGGKILQVVNATKLDTFSSSAMAGGGFVDVTGLSVNITPTSTSSKMLVQVSFNGSRYDGSSDYAISFGIAIYKSATGITDGSLPSVIQSDCAMMWARISSFVALTHPVPAVSP